MRLTRFAAPKLARVEVDYNFQIEGYLIAGLDAEDGSRLQAGQWVKAFDPNDESERVARVYKVDEARGETLLELVTAMDESRLAAIPHASEGTDSL